MYLRKDPCGIICILITYAAVFYADYVVTRWIALTVFSDSLWGSFHVIVFNVIIIFLMASHLRAVLSDPGIVPLPQSRIDFSDYHQNQNSEQQKAFLEPGSGDSPPRPGEDPSSSEYGPWTVCTRCEAYRPPRAHHCRICKRCVRRMDHHCPWINNCVGEFNQKYFIQFLFYVGMLSLYSIALIVYSWVNTGTENDHLHHHAHPNPISSSSTKEDMLTRQSRILHTVILMLESMLFGLFVLAIMIDQLSAIFSDETAVEQAKKMGRHRVRKQPKTVLMEEVCGKGSFFWWLVPCRANHHMNGQKLPNKYKLDRLDV